MDSSGARLVFCGDSIRMVRCLLNVVKSPHLLNSVQILISQAQHAQASFLLVVPSFQ